MKLLIQLPIVLLVSAIAACNTETDEPAPDYSYFQWGVYLEYYGKSDSAFLMFSRSVASSTDSLEKGQAYIHMGIYQRRRGDIFGAQQSLTSALTALDPNQPEQKALIASAYNELGNASIDLRNYTAAIRYYDLAIAQADSIDYRLEMMNGKATALQKARQFTRAIALYDSILSHQAVNTDLRARAISNRAHTQWLQDPKFPVLDQYREALQIRIDHQIYDGQNASYAHLSDYYASINRDSARYYAEKMYHVASDINSPEDRLEAADKLIRLSSSAEQKSYWYQLFKSASDSLQFSRDTTRNRFALARFDLQKSKTDNLLLQRRVGRQRLYIAGLSAAAILIIAVLSAWYQRRRRRLKLESANAIREARLATSKKVHDVVANGLYRIMNELEHREDVDREPLMNKIEGLYEKSRNISYEEVADNSPDFHKQMHELLSSFSNEYTKLIVVGNQPGFWKALSATQKQELRLVLNELLVNMKKHSGAKNVVLRFNLETATAFVQYKDDGVGISADKKHGNGLKNTVTRINSLNGQIKFGDSAQPGVNITISFPLETNQS